MTKLTALLFVLMIACKASVTNENLFVIPSYTGDQKNPLQDTSKKYEPGFADVFRILGKDTTYVARLFRLDDGAVRQYQTWIVENVLYDKASYRWLNDSTVSFYLLNSVDQKSKRFNLTGSGATTSVWEE